MRGTNEVWLHETEDASGTSLFSLRPRRPASQNGLNVFATYSVTPLSAPHSSPDNSLAPVARMTKRWRSLWCAQFSLTLASAAHNCTEAQQGANLGNGAIRGRRA